MEPDYAQLLGKPTFLASLGTVYDDYINGQIPPSISLDALFDTHLAAKLKHPSNQGAKHVGRRPSLTLIRGDKS